jgi:titin
MPFIGGRASASRGFFGGGATPLKPTSLSAIEGNAQVTISFTNPTFDGGLNISNYQYALSTDGVSFGSWIAFSPADIQSPVTIGGLSNGIQYYIKLRAENALGAGEESDILSTNTTPFTVPSAPSITSVTPQNGQVYIEYSAGFNGGRPITGYFIQHSTNNGATWSSNVNSGNDLNHTVTGLSNGTPYIFRVFAVSIAGNGLFSASSSSVTPRTVPSQVATPGSSSGDQSFSISWTNPADGGSAITGYTVEYSTNGGSTWVGQESKVSSARNHTWTSLANGTSHVGRVRANNVAGSGTYSAASTARTPTFAAPTINSVTALPGYPVLNTPSTHNKRPFTVSFVPTSCLDYSFTRVTISRADGAFAFVDQTLSGRSWDFPQVFLNGVWVYIGASETYTVTLTTFNTAGHGVSATTTHTTSAPVSEPIDTTHTYGRLVNNSNGQSWITVAASNQARKYFDGKPLNGNESATSARIYAYVSGTNIGTVTTKRNPNVGVSGNASTGVAHSIDLYDLVDLRAIGGVLRDDGWNHDDVNTSYNFNNTTQVYSVAGGGSGVGWPAQEQINVEVEVRFTRRTPRFI